MNSFSRQRRVTHKKAYSALFQVAKKSHSELFIALHNKNGNIPSRLGLAISKKKIRLAVNRNRVKRIIRESFRTLSLHGFDVVIIAKKDPTEFNNQKLFDDLAGLWEKLNTFYPKV